MDYGSTVTTRLDGETSGDRRAGQLCQRARNSTRALLNARRSLAWDFMAEPAAVPADLAFPQNTHILSTGPAFSCKSGIERPQIRVWFPLSVDRSLAPQQGAPAASQDAVPSVGRCGGRCGGRRQGVPEGRAWIH